MTRIKNWLSRYSTYLKLIFVLSIIVIVLFELISIGKSISPSELNTILTTIPIWKVGLIAVVGFISVIPMLGYDVVLVNMLGTDIDKRSLYESSWMINTMNNIVGFGGLVSMGLRSEVYGKNKDGKDVAKALSKILLLLMSGLSIYSFIALLILGTHSDMAYLKQYWIWLVGGSLYFPVVLFLSFMKKDGYIGGMTSSIRLKLVLTSFLEWSGVLFSFILMGKLMGLSFSMIHVIPLFIAATVIGIVSMIPGELGSFDLMMIIGLSALGIQREEVVAWLLVYRLFYYLIPFVIGLVIFGKTAGAKLNDKFEGVPFDLISEFSHKVIVGLMYFLGTIVVLSATIPGAFLQHRWLLKLDPLYLPFLSNFLTILLGFSLLTMGRGLAARVSRSYVPTLILIGTTFAYSIFKGASWVVLLFLLLLLGIIVLSKKELYRYQLVYSWEMMTKDGLFFLSLTILYLSVGVVSLPKFAHRARHVPSFFIFPSESLWLVGFMALFIMFVLLFLAIRYFSHQQIVLGVPVNEKKVLTLLETYGGNVDSQLVFLKDKYVYYYRDASGESTAFLQFKTFNNKCLVMGDPNGKRDDFYALLTQFIKECDLYGYSPVFYEVSEDMVMLLHDAGFDFIKMGEEAHVNLQSFTLTGKKRKNERNVMNHFAKDGYTFDIIHPPFTTECLQDLNVISDEWLNGRTEKGFSLGFFSEDYLRLAPIAVIKDREHRIVAFANIMPTYTKHMISIDLMRYSKDAPSSVMDFLFLSLFQHLQAEDYVTFDLGMAPFSNVGTSRFSFKQERLAYLIFKFGNRFYSFKGLRAYKQKYATSWNPRYTAYSRKAFLPYVMLSLLMVDNKPIEH